VSGGSSGQQTTTVYRNAPSPYGTGSYTPPVPYQSVSVTAPDKTAAKEKREFEEFQKWKQAQAKAGMV